MYEPGCMRRLLLLLVPMALLAAFVPAGPARAAGPRNSCRPYSQPCLFPFPDDRYTVAADTPTGRRLRIPAAAMPINAGGVRWNPKDVNRSDGFSPGTSMVVRLPGLDTPAAVTKSKLVGLRDIARAYDKNASLVVIDEDTGRRRLVWAELDANPKRAADRDLLIHPGASLSEGHRYVVALRNLRTGGGRRIAAPSWFAKLRRGGRLPASLRGQAGRYRRIFTALARAKVPRGSLTLAWDFTVASRRSLVSRLLAIRNDAFSSLGDDNLSDGIVVGRVPTYHVDSVATPTVAENPNALRIVRGTLTVPCFLNTNGCAPGGRFVYKTGAADSRPVVVKDNKQVTPFVCVIPRAAATKPSRIALYGHGLLGTPDEVLASNVQDMAQEHDFTFCATPWSGMAKDDIPNALSILKNLNGFPSLADRLQQGILNAMFLGRAMAHPFGFATNPAFRGAGRALIDSRTLAYDGNSQGGILGGALTAVAPDFTRSVLGVSGMDFGGLLLQRSKDYATYESVLNTSYPDLGVRPVLLDLLQIMWDRGEGDGYAAHMTGDPLADTPAHQVLMQIAVGDFQVSQWSAEVMARTIGARVRRPVADPGRWPEVTPFYGLKALPPGAYRGSAVVVWDSGAGHTGTAPLADVPNATGTDPHEDPRSTPAAREQKARFLTDGQVVDVCGGQPCHTSVFTP